MMADSLQPTPVPAELVGLTLAAVLRQLLPGQSWKQVGKLILGRRVRIDGELCTDEARRLKDGEAVEVLSRPITRPESATTEGLVIRHLDADIVVVEKASGINTVRHPAEREWPRKRRERSPTLDDLTAFAMQRRLGSRQPRLRIVHRLDKETSGLVVFARTVRAERELGKQFAAHTVTRRYLAVIRGFLPPRTIRSWLIPDRGDGRRGSSPTDGVGKEAVTHIDVEERLGDYTMLSCRLETGRTHQIRIHLAEAGHPVCGERVYDREPDKRVPRLALHAVELGFEHPADGRPVHWDMPLPDDLNRWLTRLRPEGTE